MHLVADVDEAIANLKKATDHKATFDAKIIGYMSRELVSRGMGCPFDFDRRGKRDCKACDKRDKEAIAACVVSFFANQALDEMTSEYEKSQELL